MRDIAAMRAWAPEMVVLDEAPRIKNWQTKTAASVTRSSGDLESRLATGGFPDSVARSRGAKAGLLRVDVVASREVSPIP